MNKTPTNDSDSIRQRLRGVGLYGLAVQDAAVLAEPWVERVIDIEDRERKRRSLERRLANARIGPFKPVADFDWGWPKRIDRPLIEELSSLASVDDATNVVFVGPNGVGKTMFVKNLLHHGVLNGLTARFTTASDMLHELAAQDSDASLARRLRRFTGPQLLALDEVGYLTYDNRYADLLFEVVTRRYLSLPVLMIVIMRFRLCRASRRMGVGLCPTPGPWVACSSSVRGSPGLGLGSFACSRWRSTIRPNEG